MKKFFYGFISLIFVIFMVLYIIFFTSFGNNIIANIAQNKIKQSTGLNVNITHIKLGFSNLDIKANLEDKVDLSLKGGISFFKLGFDLDYIISLNQNSIENSILNSNFTGNIQGKINDFVVDGQGYLFGCEAKLNMRLHDYKLIALNLDAKSFKIEDFLEFLSYPIYVKGLLSAQAKILEQDLKLNGDVIIKLDTHYINYEAIKRDFSLNLPLNSNFEAQIKAKIKDDKIYILTKAYNDCLVFQTQKTLYDISNNNLDTDFSLYIPSLEKLEKFTKTKLSGAVSVLGKAHVIDYVLSDLNAEVLGMGGKIKTGLTNNKIFVDINNASLEKILALVGYGGLMNGNLNARLIDADLDFSNFDFNAEIDNAKLNTNELKKITKLEFPETIFSLNIKANAKDNDIVYNTILNSNLLNIKALNGTYNLKNKDFNANLNAFMDDLSQFSAINTNLKAKAKLDASIHILGVQIKNLDINANLANSTIKANSNGKKLDLNIDKLDLSQLFIIAGMPNYASGVINAKAHLDNVDSNHLNGVMNLEAKGMMNSTILDKIFNKKFPKNIVYNLNSEFNFKKNMIYFNTILNSSLANLSQFKGDFDTSKMLLNSNFVLNIDDFSKLGFLFNRKLKGRADFNGILSFDKNLKLVLNSSDLFKGKLQSSFKDDVLFVNLNDVDLSSLAQGLDLIDIYEGKASIKANYHLLNQQGEVDLDVKEGKLKPNLITNTLKILTLKDITKDVYNMASARALINKEKILLNLDMQANRSYVLIQSGILNLKNGDLNLPFDIKLDKANFKGSVKGNVQNPKIKLNAGSVINSIKNIIKDKTDEGLEKSNKIDKTFDQLLNSIF
ncbi:hypothetical protein DZD46_00435 [Campylobacter hepaticus]|uniref:hypothetical protein n=1 Tax=Campylobacter hepaticus TaxID=1813019 RepID=UPI000F52B032|nr:hypothetical protein [Campylobacter hepaticus]RQD94703.1 hypothetical protein DZD44_01905 [Campylobacter hepaticus]RQD99673.1 hypothetical protein DZD46_00435 [Campylobacter hepaticus]